jgi:beta-lactamase regulating signal transducer with metallopeptidase domain
MSNLLFAALFNAAAASVLGVLAAWARRFRYFQSRPALMHVLWLLVLAKLVAPPIVQVPMLVGSSRPNNVQRPAVSALHGTSLAPAAGTNHGRAFETLESGAEQTRRPETASGIGVSLSWRAVLLSLSLSGTLLLVGWGSVQHARFVTLFRQAASADERLKFIAQAAAERMGVGGRPTIYLVDATVSPFLWPRLSGPVIGIPKSLVRELSDEQLGCVICHELAHWLRRDHWANLFALLVNALYWWHPVAWWARGEMRAAQETCCDGLALSAGGLKRRCYAETLLTALEFVQANQLLQPALASGFGGSSSLQRRFEMIASFSGNGSRLPRWWSVAVSAAVASMLCIPTGAQPKADSLVWTEIASLQHEHPVTIVTSDIDWVGVGDEGGNLFTWDAKTLKEWKLRAKGAADGGGFHTVDRLQITPDGTNLYAVLDHYQMMWQFHLVNTRTDRTGAGVGGTRPHYFGFSFDTDTWIERHVDHTVLSLRKNIWGPNHRPDFESIEYEAEITQAVLSEYEERLAVTTADGKLHIHDRKTLRKLHMIPLGEQRVTGLKLSRDGKQVAVVGEQGFAKVYDTASGKETATLKGHEGDVLTVTFSQDGKAVVTGGADGTVRLWNAANGQLTGVLKGHTAAVKSVNFDPSGDRLFTGSADKTVKVWERK